MSLPTPFGSITQGLGSIYPQILKRISTGSFGKNSNLGWSSSAFKSKRSTRMFACPFPAWDLVRWKDQFGFVDAGSGFVLALRAILSSAIVIRQLVTPSLLRSRLTSREVGSSLCWQEVYWCPEMERWCGRFEVQNQKIGSPFWANSLSNSDFLLPRIFTSSISCPRLVANIVELWGWWLKFLFRSPLK